MQVVTIMSTKRHSFPERLRQLRQEQDLSQYALADSLNFSRGLLSNYEQGTREPDYDTLIVLASYFDVSTDYLLGITEERTLNKKAKSRVEHITSELVQLQPTALLDLEKYVEFLRFRDKK